MTGMAPWLLVSAGVLIGALIGGLVAMIALRRDEDGVSVRELRLELETYRGDVAEHYAETARRVDSLTQAYKSVYDHLEAGAFRLVGEEELRRRIDDASSEPVTIEGIGRRALEAEAGHAPADSAPDVHRADASKDARHGEERPDPGITGDEPGDEERNALSDPSRR